MPFNAKILLISLCFVLFLALDAAGSEEMNYTHIQDVSINAPEGLSFSSFYLTDLNINSQTTLFLNSYGKNFIVNVNATKNYFVWCDFEITVTDLETGNITVKKITKNNLIANTYGLYFQYYWTDPVITNAYLQVSVFTGLIPEKASFDSPLQNDKTYAIFSNAHITSTSFFDLQVHMVTPDEFNKRENGDYLGVLKDSITGLFAWSWSMILSFIEKIPYVGPYFVDAMTLISIVLDETLFYAKLLLIEYSETTFLTIEFFILAQAATKRGNIWRKINVVVDSHIRLFEFGILVFNFIVTIVTQIISVITRIIGAIKPV